MKVAFDTSCLVLLLDPNASAPNDPSTGVEVTEGRARIDHLISTLSQNKNKAVVSTIVLAEVLAKAGESGLQYQKIMHDSDAIELVNFDQRAAIELASLEANVWGPLRGSSNNPRQKVKVDRLIIANCKVHGVTRLYCDDEGMTKLAVQAGIEVVHTWDLPLPPKPPQMPLPFGDDA